MVVLTALKVKVPCQLATLEDRTTNAVHWSERHLVVRHTYAHGRVITCIVTCRLLALPPWADKQIFASGNRLADEPTFVP